MYWSNAAVFCTIGLLLMACGGGGSQATNAVLNTSTAPVQPAPNPKPAPTPSAIVVFEGLASLPNSSTINSANSSAPEMVIISDASQGDGLIRLTIGQTTYDLSGSVTTGAPVFQNTGGANPVRVSEVLKQTEATLASVGRMNGAEATYSYTVLGPTTPSDVADLLAANATVATYTGMSELAVTLTDPSSNQYRDDAKGDLTLNVDFGAALFDGTMNLSSATATQVSNFDITDVNATISNGTIASGVLSADVDVAQGDTSVFLNGANQLGMAPGTLGQLTGNFFGPNGSEVGGTFEFIGTDPEAFPGDPNISKVIAKGGFLGKR